MSQLMVPSSTTIDRPAPAIAWVSPGDDLWVASLDSIAGVAFLGFVERSLEEYVAVDGEGASLGRHATLAEAQRAVDAARP